jgi:hypothetical protein
MLIFYKMSLLLVKDSANLTLRELECTSTGLLKVDHVDVSALATETTLSTLNTKITTCDTSAITGSVSVTGVVTTDGSATIQPISAATLPLPTGAADSTKQDTIITLLNDLDNHGSLSATHLEQEAQTNHLSLLSGTVVAGKVQVSSSTQALSATASYVFGASGSPGSVPASTTSKSLSFDADAFRDICIFGNSTNTNDTDIQIEVSEDDVNWFHLNSQYVNLDYTTGDFGVEMKLSARYVRLSRTNNSMMADSIKAIISAK